jgi:hypothetical protein
MIKNIRIFKDRRWLACAAGVLILGGVATDRALLHAAARDADEYHARVAEALYQVPRSMGNGEWVSSDAKPLTKGAMAMLRPNITMSQRFINTNTRSEASLLLVQCRDARDLDGHYPPVCYPASGWTMSGQRKQDWTLGDGDVVHGTMYDFECMKVTGRVAMKIYNVMVLPNGTTSPDMRGVDTIARNRNMRHFGAGEIQILTIAGMDDEERKKVITTILTDLKPVIDAIRQGVTQ